MADLQIPIVPVVATPSDYNDLTAAELLEVLKLAVGGKGAFGAKKTTQLQTAIIMGAKEVWFHHPWYWRLVPYDLTTVASQAYTTFASDHDQWQLMKKKLFYTDQAQTKCEYFSPLIWTEQQAKYNDYSEARPRVMTITTRSIASVMTKVVEWLPVPDAIYTVRGFQYFRRMPDIDFVGSDNVFSDNEFDMLWLRAAFRHAAAMGMEIIRDNEWLMADRDWFELLATSVTKYGSPEVQVLGQGPIDAYQDGRELGSTGAGPGEDSFDGRFVRREG